MVCIDDVVYNRHSFNMACLTSGEGWEIGACRHPSLSVSHCDCVGDKFFKVESLLGTTVEGQIRGPCAGDNQGFHI